MWQPALGEQLDLALHHVRYSANRWDLSIDEQIRSAGIPIVGKSDTAGVRHDRSGRLADVWDVNMPVDDQRAAERSIDCFQFVVTGRRSRSAPKVVWASMQ